ncbi:hypothetical protein EOA19_17035 [Mesorhizobium sp. M7A.F.Ca.US.010.02.1.1]|nr:hypothetical protein EOA19_17035 [Mesorhizobium sp. M7A.F.Ca.US.010.02.1.1]
MPTHHAFVILGRSKERSDAAQTLGSMPRPLPRMHRSKKGSLTLDTTRTAKDSIAPLCPARKSRHGS